MRESEREQNVRKIHYNEKERDRESKDWGRDTIMRKRETERVKIEKETL